MKKIILASNSPRRQQLLTMAEIPFEVRVSNAEELINPALSMEEIVIDIAEQKAKPLLDGLTDEIIITADTVVVLNGQIIGKPKDETEAKDILKRLSGEIHEVMTGVCLQQKGGEKICFHDTTRVFFNTLSEHDILYYIEHYKPFDKAGAYAIQEWIGAIGIQKIEGCFYNVMGLPIQRVVHALKRFN